MTEEDLRQIEERANAATPGPWRVLKEERDHFIDTVCCKTPIVREDVTFIEDAEFIAHARTDIPALITALREAWDVCTVYERFYRETRNRAEAAEARVRELEAAIEKAVRTP